MSVCVKGRAFDCDNEVTTFHCFGSNIEKTRIPTLPLVSLRKKTALVVGLILLDFTLTMNKLL